MIDLILIIFDSGDCYIYNSKYDIYYQKDNFFPSQQFEGINNLKVKFIKNEQPFYKISENPIIDI